jgi:TRAP-type C4-dicarboxylate transport system substrate-binding protein
MTALATNLIDGAENNWPSYVTTNQYKIARYYTQTEHAMGPEILIMNRRAWQELSQEDKAIFRTAARDSSKYMRATWQDWEERSRKQAEQEGVTVVSSIDRKAFEDATKSLRDEMHRDPKFRPLMDRIEAVR